LFEHGDGGDVDVGDSLGVEDDRVRFLFCCESADLGADVFGVGEEEPALGPDD